MRTFRRMDVFRLFILGLGTALLGCSDPSEDLFEKNRQRIDGLSELYRCSESVEDLAPHLARWEKMLSDWLDHINRWKAMASEDYLYFNFELAALRLMNIYVHLGRTDKAFNLLQEIVWFYDRTEGFAMQGLSSSQKALIRINEWRYIETGLGTPDWETEESLSKLLEIVRDFDNF